MLRFFRNQLFIKLGLLFVSILLMALSAQAQKVSRESIRVGEKDRTYYLFVPEKTDAAAPAPLLVLLHDSGHDGLLLVDKWKEFAKKEGIILAGPDSLNPQNWNIPDDGPDFIHELVEALKAKYPINPRRVYLFGHSAGAVAGLFFSLLESQYFAATAVHAGSLRTKDNSIIEDAKRKIPISIFVGTNDQFFSLADVRSTRDGLNAKGFNAQLTELKGHTHDYYSSADEINKSVWDFLKTHELSEEPKYENYNWGK